MHFIEKSKRRRWNKKIIFDIKVKLFIFVWNIIILHVKINKQAGDLSFIHFL
jgi:hypothetical protein